MYLLPDFSTKLFIIIYAGILGACVGSFLNVVVARVPVMLENTYDYKFNLIIPRSHCPKCHTTLSYLDLIPILSFIFLKQKCRYCKHKLSVLEPIIETLTALIFILTAIFIHSPLLQLKILCISCLVLPLIIIDIKHQLLPDCITLLLLWCGLMFSCGADSTISSCEAIFGAVLGYCGLRGFVNVYEVLSKKPAMGGGDFKLFAAIGAWTGYLSLPLILFIASLFGSVFTIIYRIISRRNIYQVPLAFGPWLLLAWLIVWVIDYAKL
jgi:general secretion pathway protein O